MGRFRGPEAPAPSISALAHLFISCFTHSYYSYYCCLNSAIIMTPTPPRRKIRWSLRGRQTFTSMPQKALPVWLVLILLFGSPTTPPMPTASATSIKWTPADDTKRDANADSDKPNAATAPRSQRYWDEHGIERPDYAKTDAEVAQEGLVSATETAGGKLFLGAAILAMIYGCLVWAGEIVAFWDKGSFRLGSGGKSSTSGRRGASGYASFAVSSSSAASREEEARNARLARFDMKQE